MSGDGCYDGAMIRPSAVSPYNLCSVQSVQAVQSVHIYISACQEMLAQLRHCHSDCSDWRDLPPGLREVKFC